MLSIHQCISMIIVVVGSAYHISIYHHYSTRTASNTLPNIYISYTTHRVEKMNMPLEFYYCVLVYVDDIKDHNTSSNLPIYADFQLSLSHFLPTWDNFIPTYPFPNFISFTRSSLGKDMYFHATIHNGYNYLCIEQPASILLMCSCNVCCSVNTHDSNIQESIRISQPYRHKLTWINARTFTHIDIDTYMEVKACINTVINILIFLWSIIKIVSICRSPHTFNVFLTLFSISNHLCLEVRGLALTLNMWGPSCLGLTRLISWLLMSWRRNELRCCKGSI